MATGSHDVDTATFNVCQTCFLVTAGYSLHELGQTPDREPLNLIPESGHLVCGDDEPWFSWASCEGCGEPLGGDRYVIIAFD